MTRHKSITIEDGNLTHATSGFDNAQGSLALEAATPLAGSFSATTNNTASTYGQEDFTASPELFISLLYRLDADPAANNRTFEFRTASANTVGSIRTRTGASAGTGILQLYNAAGTAVGTQAVVTLGSTYIIGIHYDTAVGVNLLEWWIVAAPAAGFGSVQGTTTAGTGDPSRIRIGSTISAAVDCTFDNIYIDTVSMPTENFSGGGAVQTDKTYTGAAAFQGDISKTYTAKAAFQGLISKLYTAAAAFQGDIQRQYTAAAAFQGLPTKAYTAIATFQGQADKTYTGIASFQGLVNKQYTAIALFQNLIEKPYTAAASFQGQVDKPYTALAAFQGLQTRPYTAGAAFAMQIDKAFTAAAAFILNTSPERNYSAGAVFSGQTSKTYSALAFFGANPTQYQVNFVRGGSSLVTQHSVVLCDEFGKPQEYIPFFELSYGCALGNVGMATIKTHYDFPQRLLRDGCHIEIYRSFDGGPQYLETESVWFLRAARRKIERTGNRYTEIKAPRATELLNSRVIAYASKSPQTLKNMAVDTMMVEIVRENLGPDALDPSRVIDEAYLSYGPERGVGPVMEREFAKARVLATLVDLSSASAELGDQIYFDVVQAARGRLLFQTYVKYRGRDLTRNGGGVPVILSYEGGTIESPEISIDYTKTASFIYALGKGSGDNRMISTAENPDSIKRGPFSRREEFVDAKNASSFVSLANEALMGVRRFRPRRVLTAEIISKPSAPYGVWRFGDQLEVDFEQVSYPGMVQSIEVNVKEQSETVNSSFRGEVDV